MYMYIYIRCICMARILYTCAHIHKCSVQICMTHIPPKHFYACAPSKRLGRGIYIVNRKKKNQGWLWSVGSIRFQVTFAEYCLFYRSLLQMRPIISSILLTKATPYVRNDPDLNRLTLYASKTTH